MKINKNIVLIIITLLLIVGIYFLGEYLTKNKKDKVKYDEDMKYVQITVKNYGDIIVELDPKNAPITVENFLKLVNEHFYDGVTFHRIIDGFMIQSGEYDEEGNKKTSDKIKGEFIQNNVNNEIKHTRGTISMVRDVIDFDSASCGFFILQEDNEYLDGTYAAFGKVISGMDIIDKIVKDSHPTDDNGSIAIEDRQVIETIKETEVTK